MTSVRKVTAAYQLQESVRRAEGQGLHCISSSDDLSNVFRLPDKFEAVMNLLRSCQRRSFILSNEDPDAK